MAHISVSGQLALATLKSAPPLADGRSWTALKMGNVVVSGNVNLGLDGVTAQITVDALDLNLSSNALTPLVPPARLDWTRAFDLDGDGQYDDLLDPGAELPTPVDLAIDLCLEPAAAGARLADRHGRITPTIRSSRVATDINDVTIDNVMLTFGDVRLAGTAEFALVKRSVVADVDGTGSGSLLRMAS